MAAFTELTTGKIHYLNTLSAIGRMKSKVEIFIDNPKVSNLHAVVEWLPHAGRHSNGCWIIKDYSRNGTWLNQRKLKKSEPVKLEKGQSIALAVEEEPMLRVENVDPPDNMLVNCVMPLKTLSLDQVNMFPCEDDPEVVIYKDQKNSCWSIYYSQSHNLPFQDGEELHHNTEITIAGEAWRTFLVFPLELTRPENRRKVELDSLLFLLIASDDERHISLGAEGVEGVEAKLDVKEKVFFRIFHRLVLQKLTDIRQGIETRDCGWVDTESLMARLNLDECHLNIQIFRMRKYFSEFMAFVADLEKIVERRRGQLRTGVALENIKVNGEKLTNKTSPEFGCMNTGS